MEFLKEFRNWQDVEEHPGGTVIFPEGAPAEYLYVILSGDVELRLRGEVLEVENTGGIIGEMALFESASRNATATSLTDVKLARLDREQLNAKMNESNEFSLRFMVVLANRLRQVNSYISNHIGPA